MVRTQIQIQDEQLKWLKRQAFDKSISMAQLIRDSIDFYRTHLERRNKGVDKKKNAVAAVGAFSSSDFSRT